MTIVVTENYNAVNKRLVSNQMITHVTRLCSGIQEDESISSLWPSATKISYYPPEKDIFDAKHSKKEKRYHAYGWTTTGWYVWIWYTYKGKDTIRIIGGKKMK